MGKSFAERLSCAKSLKFEPLAQPKTRLSVRPSFCRNLECHFCTHIVTSIKCYLHSLRYVYLPFTNI